MSRPLPYAALALLAPLALLPVARPGADPGRAQPAPAARPAARPDAAPPRAAAPEAALAAELAAAGWRADAAAAVARLSAEFLGLLDGEPGARARTLLRGLGRRPEVQTLLARRPEAAGLLARADDPAALAEALDAGGADYLRVAGLFVLHCDPRGARELADALRHDRGLLCRLLARGLLGAEALFLFGRDGPGAAEYAAWLRAELHDLLLAGDDGALAALAELSLAHGPELRRRLGADAAFRGRFRRELWPRLCRVAGRPGQALELYAADPRVWEVLALPEGEALLADWGPLPLELLAGEGAYPDDLRPGVLSALDRGDAAAVEALLRFRADAGVHALLRRPLPPAALAAALARLQAAGPDYPQRLRYFRSLGDAALVEELGPPPSGPKTWLPLWQVYYVGKKLAQGRAVSAADWAAAAVDAGAALAPVLRAGAAVRAAGGPALQTALRGAGREAAARRLGPAAAGRLTAGGLRAFTAAGLCARAQAALRGLDRLGAVDVTAPAQLLFRHGPLGRAPFRALTGLEARVFMRGDARVFLHLGRLACGKAREYLNARALELLPEAPGGAGRGDGTPAPNAGGAEAWRRHVAAWWLLGAAGLDRP